MNSISSRNNTSRRRTKSSRKESSQLLMMLNRLYSQTLRSKSSIASFLQKIAIFKNKINFPSKDRKKSKLLKRDKSKKIKNPLKGIKKHQPRPQRMTTNKISNPRQRAQERLLTRNWKGFRKEEKRNKGRESRKKRTRSRK